MSDKNYDNNLEKSPKRKAIQGCYGTLKASVFTKGKTNAISSHTLLLNDVEFIIEEDYIRIQSYEGAMESNMAIELKLNFPSSVKLKTAVKSQDTHDLHEITLQTDKRFQEFKKTTQDSNKHGIKTIKTLQDDFFSEVRKRGLGKDESDISPEEREQIRMKYVKAPQRIRTLSPVQKEFLVKSQQKELMHVETRIAKSDLIAVLRCVKCEKEQELPSHCSKIMSFEESEFVCSDCGTKIPVPTHCKELMKVVIKRSR